MGQVHPLPQSSSTDARALKQSGTVQSIDSAQCGLCGAKLSARALRHHVVSPLSCYTTITVCHTCQRAALGEGYRPAE
jgi:hypothetical protein